MDILKITWEMEGGIEGEDDDPNNPLSRALGKLLSDGQPFVRLVQCFCADRRQHGGNPALRWLGVFILSAGGRIVFFPGFSSTKQYVEGIRGKAQMWKQAFEFDHISVEKNLRRWHMTSPRSKKHLAGPKTTELGQERYLWCGLSVSSLDELRILKNKTSVIGHVSQSDVKRRHGVFLKAREKAMFQVLEWHDHVWENKLDGFWHFGLIISPPSSPTYMGCLLGFPEGSPFLATPLPKDPVQIPVRHHRLEFSKEIGLQITTAFLPGGLKVPVSLTALQ